MSVIRDIGRLIRNHELDKAKSLIKTVENDNLRQIFDSMIASSMGHFEERMRICQGVINRTPEYDIAHIMAFEGMIWANIRLGKYKTAYSYIEDAERVYDKYKEKTNIEYPEGYPTLMNAKGSYYLETGRLDSAIDCFTEALQIYKTLEIEDRIAQMRNNLAFAYHKLGKIDDALSLYKEAMTYYEKLSKQQAVCRVKSNIAEIYRFRSDYEIALHYHYEVLEIRIQLENEYDKALSTYYVGLVYYEMAKYENAKMYLSESIELWKKVGNEQWLSASMLILGWTYMELGRDYCDILQEMEQLAAKSENIIIDARYLLFRSMHLKRQERMEAIAKAQILLEEIIETKLFDFEIMYDAILLYCDLLFIEFKMTSNPEIYEEAKSYIDSLEQLTRENAAYGKMIEIMFLKAKMALIDLKYDEAEKILTQADLIAEEKGMRHYYHVIERIRDLLEKDMMKVKTIIDKNHNLMQRAKVLELTDYLNQAKEIKNQLKKE